MTTVYLTSSRASATGLVLGKLRVVALSRTRVVAVALPAPRALERLVPRRAGPRS